MRGRKRHEAAVGGTAVMLQIQKIGGEESAAKRRTRGERLYDALADVFQFSVYAVFAQRVLKIVQNVSLGFRKTELGRQRNSRKPECRLRFYLAGDRAAFRPRRRW